jgi:hypothetical protein
LNVLCHKFEHFHEQLYKAFKTAEELIFIAEKLKIDEAELRTMSAEPVTLAWRRLLRLAAERNKLSALVELAGKQRAAAAFKLPELYAEAPCGFLTVAQPVPAASLAVRQSTYLLCDRKDECEPFTVHRTGTSVVPLIALGHHEEGPDLLRRRIERCVVDFEVVSVSWEPDFDAEHRYRALQAALTKAQVAASGTEDVPSLLRRPNRLVLLHQVCDVDDTIESASDVEYLKDYYRKLAADLGRLDAGFPPPFLVQCIAFRQADLEAEAVKLAREIAAVLAGVSPAPRTAQYKLRPISDHDIQGFLMVAGKSHLWQQVRRDIYRFNLGFAWGRKSSREVFEVLRRAFLSDDSNSERRS